MRARAFVTAQLLILSGCHSVVAFEPPPAADGARSGLLLLQGAGEVTAVFAVDLAGGERWPVFSSHALSAMFALRYSCALSRLGLDPGLQALTGAVAGGDRLPPPMRIDSIALGDEIGEWTPLTELPDAVSSALRRIPLPANNRCHAAGAVFRPRPVSIPNDGRGPPAFALAIDDYSTLAGAHGGFMYRVDISGDVARVPNPDQQEIVAGYRDPSGDLWLVTGEWKTYRGTIEGGFTVVTATAPMAPHEAMALGGPRGGEPFELYAEASGPSNDRVFARFDGHSWTELATATWDTNFLPAVAWVGPQEAVAIGVGPSTLASVLRHVHGQLKEEILTGGSGPTGIMQHPTLGTIVGTEAGGLHRYDGSVWIRMEGSNPLNFIRIMTPEGDGFLFAGVPELNFGPSGFSQYQPSIRFCDVLETYTDYATRFLARLGPTALLALTQASFSAPMGLTILDRESEAESCSGE